MRCVGDPLASTQAPVASSRAHAQKNCLAVIESLSALLERSPHDPVQAARLEVLRETTSRLRELLLDELREGLDDESAPVRLDEVARQAASELAARAVARGVTLEVTLTPCSLAGDRRLLEEAVRNILLNAIDASPQGSTVLVEVRSALGHISLTCANDEPPVPAPARSVSTGLGLPIVRRIVASHLGTTTFERRDGRVQVVLRFGNG